MASIHKSLLHMTVLAALSYSPCMSSILSSRSTTRSLDSGFQFIDWSKEFEKPESELLNALINSCGSRPDGQFLEENLASNVLQNVHSHFSYKKG